jgi:hypothetical protein
MILWAKQKFSLLGVTPGAASASAKRASFGLKTPIVA